MSDVWLTVALVLAFAAGVGVGYLVCALRLPHLLGRMTDTELAALGRRALRHRPDR